MFQDIKRNSTHKKDPEKFLLNLDNGIQLDIVGKKGEKFVVEFWNDQQLVYSSLIESGMFSKLTAKYYSPWKCVVKDVKGNIQYEHCVNLQGQNVLVSIDSASLGDNLAWFPQVYEFSKIHGCKLHCKTFFNELFRESYPDVNFIEPSNTGGKFYAKYTIGYFYGEDLFMYTPVDPRTIPLAQTAASILGIPYKEMKPNIGKTWKNTHSKKVCIATHSTARAKYWLRENGWQDIIDYLVLMGYEVQVINREKNELYNVIDLSGERPLNDRIQSLIECDFFIGLGSGLSWLAWALNVPVIMISGFSSPFTEFSCYRVHNHNVCNSCWNDITHKFDKGDFNWCPRNKDFECSRQISSISVISEILKLERDLL
jgi:autotransporter strand-loop-strand O-heptosyltransferase